MWMLFSSVAFSETEFDTPVPDHNCRQRRCCQDLYPWLLVKWAMSKTIKSLRESAHVLPTVPGLSWNFAQTFGRRSSDGRRPKEKPVIIVYWCWLFWQIAGFCLKGLKWLGRISKCFCVTRGDQLRSAKDILKQIIYKGLRESVFGVRRRGPRWRKR